MSTKDKSFPGEEADPVQKFAQMLQGFAIFQILYVTAKLGLIDLLQNQPLPVGQLADTLKVHHGALYRLLQALTSLGLLVRRTDGAYVSTELGDVLASGSLREATLHLGDVDYHAWSGLLHTVQTGETAFDHVYGMNYFTYLEQNTTLAHNFHSLMAKLAQDRTIATLEAYDFSSVTRVIDLGAGQGGLLIAIIQAYPQLTGALFDLPLNTAAAQQNIAYAHLTANCTAVSGNFFEAVPSDYDLYLLSAIIHDWDDEHALLLLQNCHRAMPAHAKLLLCERIMPDHIEERPSFQPNSVIAGDLDMLVLTGGYERTTSQYRALLQRSGLNLTKIIATSTSWSLLEAEPFLM